jgi:hypothetical protein
MLVQQRAAVARALITSAVIMLGLSVMFWREQRSVAIALMAVGVVDAALSFWFRRNLQ